MNDDRLSRSGWNFLQRQAQIDRCCYCHLGGRLDRLKKSLLLAVVGKLKVY